MKIVILAGGWHFPRHFYDTAKKVKVPDGSTLDFVAICHRNMTAEVHKEYLQKIEKLPEDFLKKLDQELYASFADIEYLRETGWQAALYENSIGDFNFINQWLDTNPPQYDLYIYLSDDIYLTHNWQHFLIDFIERQLTFYKFYNGEWVPSELSNNWVYVGNCPNPGRKVMRSSTGIFPGHFLQSLGRFEMSKVSLTRTGQNNNLWNIQDIADWNQVQRNLQDYMEVHNLDKESFRLSNTYRVSKYMIEAERGLLSNINFFQQSYLTGVKQIIS